MIQCCLFYITEENSTWQAEAATCTAKYDQYRQNVLVNSTLPTQILDVLQGSVSMMPVCLFVYKIAWNFISISIGQKVFGLLESLIQVAKHRCANFCNITATYQIPEINRKPVLCLNICLQNAFCRYLVLSYTSIFILYLNF